MDTFKDNPQKIPENEASSRAAQMLAEMFGLVCHPEYYQQGDQMVFYLLFSPLTKAFVVHFAGLEASIYWATFPSSYLRMVHSGRTKVDMKVNIKHTRPCNLLHTKARGKFLEDFVFLVRFIADGYANVGNYSWSSHYI